MGKVAIMTDSNSGITQSEAKQLGIHLAPVPFTIDGTTYFEDIDLKQEQFYELLEDGREVITSMAPIGIVQETWEELLKTHDEVVYIPLSKALSSGCEVAQMAAQEYGGKVAVVDNIRVSVTQRQSVLDAMELAETGMSAGEIKEKLEAEKLEASIYIMVDTMTYLKKGGRVTPAAAALGTLLKIKPVLQIQGEKLDSYGKARTVKQAKSIMIEAMKRDFEQRFHDPEGKNVHLEIAYTKDLAAAEEFKKQVQEEFPNHEIYVAPLALSVSCHIGPGALAIACSKKIEY